MKIYLKDNCVPYRVSAPRPIPLRFQEPANAEISKDIASGIIVPCDKPTEWAQRLINLEIPVLVQSLKSSNVGLGWYLDGRLFKCCLNAAANP